jgi:hypothetical protein
VPKTKAPIAAVEPFRKDRLLISFVIKISSQFGDCQKNKAPPVILSRRPDEASLPEYLGGTAATVVQHSAALESADVLYRLLDTSFALSTNTWLEARPVQ